MKKNILIISNDRLNIQGDKISSDSNDTINIIESLSKKNHLYFLCRIEKNFKNFISKKKIYKNFVRLNLFNLKKKIINHKIFMISITPYNFLIFLILKFSKKKVSGYVYLRSDGYKEYYYKYGNLGKIIYKFMHDIIISSLKIISVSQNITGLKKTSSLIEPSEIEGKWLVNQKKQKLDKPRFLYLGRYKKEKGIFSLISLINLLNFDFKLDVVGTKKNFLSKDKKINYFKEIKSTQTIIKFYDKCNIFVLPSYTEGAPKVILESLARYRPVIIFKEISHVKKDFKGIFICKRSPKDFKNKVNYILKNYKQILKQIKRNKIHSKQEFQNNLSRIVT
jgi:glycosyltransferase involved in cell wall biosynthesis